MWTPIQTPTELPPLGAQERPWLDFKPRWIILQRHELAKDGAAMANAMGGTVLVGSAEGGLQLSAYVPKTAVDAVATVRAYQEAVRDLVRPPPLVDAQRIIRRGLSQREDIVSWGLGRLKCRRGLSICKPPSLLQE